MGKLRMTPGPKMKGVANVNKLSNIANAKGLPRFMSTTWKHPRNVCVAVLRSLT